MPENLPPSGWGPASFDERDLDAVLAGQLAGVPDALGPVADVLLALRAAPAPAELRGEANIMAEFRAHGPGGVARSAEPAPTRPLSVLPADPSPRRQSTRRRRRQPARAVSGWAGALTGVAAAAAIVIVVAFTGNLPAPIDRLAHFGNPTAKASTASSSSHPMASKTATSSPSMQPTTPPPATHSTASAQSEARTTCRAYYDDFTHQVPPSRLDAEISLWRQLTTMAGTHNPEQVYRFCLPYVSGMFPHWMPTLNPYPASQHPSAGNQSTNQPASPNGQAAQTPAAQKTTPAAPDTPGAQNGLQGSQPANSNGLGH